MTNEEAKRILHPSTSAEALAEIGHYAGFRRKKAKIEAVTKACLAACEALEKQIPKKPKHMKFLMDEGIGSCPSCGNDLNSCMKFCPECGQALDWAN